MAYQATFQRYEIKYLLSLRQKELVLKAMEPYMALDRYGRTTIRNLYFDTVNYRLIRHSIEKPVYKEKLRLRSYCQTTPDTPVFVELKKKYRSVVYKRRLAMNEPDALAWLSGEAPGPECQIGAEIDYFLQYYASVHPTVFLSYEREAFCCRAGGDLRITFDDNILCRQDGLSLVLQPGGCPLLPQDRVLMEIKTSDGIPLWLTQVLTREQIFKTSFSKYGTAYSEMIFPNFKGGYLYA